MAEVPYRVQNLDPINIDFFDNSVNAACSLDWKGSVQATRANFYLNQFVEPQTVSPVYMEFRATQPNPDTILVDWKSFTYTSEALFDGVEMEAAPAIAHLTYFSIIAALYSKATLIDPENPPVSCPTDGLTGGTATECKPLADMEMEAVPIALIVVDDAPLASLSQDNTPEATLDCKIIS
jgi:hypothetical protein